MRQLLEINPEEFDDRILSEEEILRWFDLCDAVWLHDGNPEKTHAELTSGLCSNGYFDCSRVLCYPNISEILAQQIVRKLKTGIPFEIKEVDWAVGSAYTAITLSYEVARILKVRHGFVEKDPTDSSGKRMAWRRMIIPTHSKILQIEELITTSHTTMEVRRAIEEGNLEPVRFLPVVGALVHRPPKLPVEYNDFRVVALIEREIWAVSPQNCPLCQAGSQRLRPKTHWRELTGKR